MLDTAKKRGVTRFVLDPQRAAGASQGKWQAIVLGVGGTDCRVKSARWSLVKKRRPVPPFGGPASSVKILTGISTLAPVSGITYFRHSVLSARAAIGTRLIIKINKITEPAHSASQRRLTIKPPVLKQPFHFISVPRKLDPCEAQPEIARGEIRQFVQISRTPLSHVERLVTHRTWRRSRFPPLFFQ